MTDRIENARKLNSNSNLYMELRIFELRLTTLAVALVGGRVVCMRGAYCLAWRWLNDLSRPVLHM